MIIGFLMRKKNCANDKMDKEKGWDVKVTPMSRIYLSKETSDYLRIHW